MTVRRPLSGFGSAGSSRSLRRTATAAGVGQTATVSSYADIRRVRPANLSDPTAEQLWPWVRMLECWWCQDGRVFRSLSGHWERGHNLDLQHIRDILGVNKRYAFISEQTRDLHAARGRANYDPTKLHNVGGPHALSEYGKEANRAKLLAIPPEQRAENRRKALAAMHASHTVTLIEHICKICGAAFTDRKGRPRSVCSPVCHLESKRRLADSPAFWEALARSKQARQARHGSQA